MQPRLHVVKRKKGLTTKTQKTVVRIAVVDHEKNSKYPKNFVCVLPGQLGSPDCAFEQLYGSNAKEMAKKLLTDALKREKDAEVKLEMKRRLQTLETQNPTPQNPLKGSAIKLKP